MPISLALSYPALLALDRMANLLSSNLALPVPVAPNLARAVQQGLVQGVLLAGRNPAAGTTLSDLWAYPSTSGGSGQPVRANPTTAYTMALVSDSANDASAGTGAQQVAVSYLDASYNQHTAVFTMNGTTAVTVATSIDGGAGGAVTALRQLGLEVIAVGAGLVAAGNIYACDSTSTYTAGVPQTPAKVYDCILAGDNDDSSSQFTIPAGYYGALLQIIPAVNDYTATVKYAKIRVGCTTSNNGIFLSFDIAGCASSGNALAIKPEGVPIFQPKSDIRIQAITSAATEVGCLNTLALWPALS